MKLTIILFLFSLPCFAQINSLERKVDYKETENAGLNKFERINLNESRTIELNSNVKAVEGKVQGLEKSLKEVEKLEGEVKSLKAQVGSLEGLIERHVKEFKQFKKDVEEAL